MWFFKKRKKDANDEEKQMPSAEQIIEDIKELRKSMEEVGENLDEEEIPDIICTLYSATQNIDLDINYVTEILNKSKNDNLNN